MAAARAWAAELQERASRQLPGLVALCVVSLLALAALTWCLPVEWPRANAWGGNVKGVLHFRTLLGLTGLPSLPLPTYTPVFEALLFLCWLSYGLVVLGTSAARRDAPRLAVPALAGFAGLLAVFAPPALSTDVFAYAAHARMALLYGWNPYLHSPMELKAVGDASARFQVWDLPSVYPPVWTLLSCAALWPLKHGSLWCQVVALKGIEAAAVVGAAAAAREIAERARPGWGLAAFLAISLNPLFLVEGPISGHNDVLMVALLLVALCWHARGATARAFLFLGLSAGIKFITLGLLPWLVIEECRKWSPRAVLRVLALASLAILPIVVGYLPYWNGPETLLATLSRVMIGDRGVADPDHNAGRLARGLLAEPVAGFGTLALRYGPVLGVYVALTVWVRRAPGRLATAWTLFAGLLALLPRWPYPWYFLWPTATAPLRWNRLHGALLVLCALVAMALMSGYGVRADFFARPPW